MPGAARASTKRSRKRLATGRAGSGRTVRFACPGPAMVRGRVTIGRVLWRLIAPVAVILIVEQPLLPRAERRVFEPLSARLETRQLAAPAGWARARVGARSARASSRARNVR